MSLLLFYRCIYSNLEMLNIFPKDVQLRVRTFLSKDSCLNAKSVLLFSSSFGPWSKGGGPSSSYGMNEN